ncbi:MAG: ATP-binding protein, partial [Fervidobacterium sp.]
MRLKEIYIERYGPLNRLHIKFGQGVQPIFGDNESGKTLLVDCILKMLAGKGAGWDILLDRVAETPEGFLILEEDGKSLKLEKGQSLADYLSINAEELRNVFVIREADLRIPEEYTFYEKLTDRLTGLRTEDIRKIIEKLREIGRLTEGNDLSDAKALGKPKSKLKEAKKLLEDIKKYLEEAEKTNIPELEAEIFQTKMMEETLKEKIELLEKARERDNFINLERKLDEAKKALNTLKNKPTEQMMSSLQIKLAEQAQKELKKPFLERINQFTKSMGLILIPSTVAAWIISIISRFTNLVELAFPLLLLVIFMLTFGVFCYASKNLSAIDKSMKELIKEARKLGIGKETLFEIEKELGELREEVRKLKSSLEQNIGVLKNSLTIDGEADEALKAAEAELLRKKATIEFDIEMEFNENELKKAKEEIEDVRKKLERLNKESSEHNEKLKQFSNRAHELNFQSFTYKELEIAI